MKMNQLRNNVIVAGVDGSASSTAAARWAAAEAVQRDAELKLVMAYEISVSFAGPGVTLPSTLYAELRESAQSALTKTRDAIGGEFPGLTITTALNRDRPHVLLLREAEHALLTVIGSHGENGFSAALLGSVAFRVAAASTGPVVVIGNRADTQTGTGGGPIWVGLDGSSTSEDALAFAFEEASLHQRELVAIHSWNDEPRDGHLSPYPLDLDRAHYAEEQRVLGEQLAGWSEKYPDVTVRALVKRGRPAATLLRSFEDSPAADRPSLLVVGSRGRGGFAGLLLGSTSQALIAHARCPVAVVRPSVS